MSDDIVMRGLDRSQRYALTHTAHGWVAVPVTQDDHWLLACYDNGRAVPGEPYTRPPTRPLPDRPVRRRHPLHDGHRDPPQARTADLGGLLAEVAARLPHTGESRLDVDEVYDRAGLAGYLPLIPVGLAQRIRRAADRGWAA